MAINLTDQVVVLNKCELFKALAIEQLLARKPYFDKMTPERLKEFYQSGKDPVLVELYQIYKGMDGYFKELLDGID